MRDRPDETVWRKSTYSNSDGDCVDVADGVTRIVPVRDSKDPEGPALVFTPEAWRSFVASVRVGDFPAAN
ncbi:DUF397 domain-containing protein [Streptomyces sp. CBMA156]|uniref:DUF397 domain-containing protein n=1 Tax=Streptomyces sp. CBMA156 TaxID=1930280 RepID=UPI0016621BDD|nr:DUF397 domain-containing protein [Streptomyces sp. CBMA156]MBD0672702.1 DUF397 domain-containing protein [Streptomyces sp. CBMA156]